MEKGRKKIMMPDGKYLVCDFNELLEWHTKKQQAAICKANNLPSIQTVWEKAEPFTTTIPASTPLSPETRAKATTFFDKAHGYLGMLWGRWQDEREYENFADYQSAAEKFCTENGATFQKLTKRPFCLFYTIDNRNLKIQITGKGAQWFRV